MFAQNAILMGYQLKDVNVEIILRTHGKYVKTDRLMEWGVEVTV